MNDTYNFKHSEAFEREEEERRKELLLIEADEYERIMKEVPEMIE